jgi:uncharacterized phage protein (TIGR02220 family)
MNKKGSYRATYSVLLDDPDFRKLPADARHIFHVLKLSRLNNIANIFICGKGELMTVAEQTGISIERVEEGIKELARGLWIYYQPPILWIRNGLKFDPLFVDTNENHKKSVSKALGSLPKSDLIIKFCQYYSLSFPEGYSEEAITRISEGYPDNLGKPLPITDSDSDYDPRPDSETDSYMDTEAPSSGKPNHMQKGGEIPYREITDHLNQCVEANYKATTLETRKLIKARWIEGFRLDDFKKVHAIKSTTWKGTDMEKFLRPSTLYGVKFEGYLNEKIADRKVSERTLKNIQAGDAWEKGQGIANAG